MQVARVYLDVETTGLDPKYHSVIEVGAVAVSQEGAELATFGALANPGDWAMRNSEPRAFEVSQIDPDEVRAAKPIEEVAQELREWLQRHIGTLHAFPVVFDRGFLSRHPWKVELGWKECVQEAAREIMAKYNALSMWYGKPKLPKLSEAAKFFGVTIRQAHRALEDAKVTSRIHREIIEQRIMEPIEDEADHLIQDGM